MWVAHHIIIIVLENVKGATEKDRVASPIFSGQCFIQGQVRIYVITKYAIITHITAKTFGLHFDIAR